MLIRRRSPRLRGSLVTVSAVVALLALGACDSADGGTAKTHNAAGGSGSGVVAPGRPGELTKTLTPEEAVRAAPDNTPNSADVSYARMMIVHHGQALEMTRLATGRAGSTPVKRLAARITATQQPEIEAMRGWLESNGVAKSQEGHDHGAMPGMATPEQLAELRAAKGKAFDALFVQLMITHHQGAITMATEALSEGNNVQIEEMATDIVAQQTVEMDRMRSF